MTFEPITTALASLVPPKVHARVVSLDDPEVASFALPDTLANAVARRRAEFAAGRIAARQALIAAGALAPAYPPIGPMRAPLWPAGYVGSISHTLSIALAVAAADTVARSVGIDIEQVMPAKRASNIGGKLATRAELTAVASLGMDEPTALTILFSTKESLFKCLAPLVGHYFDFLDVEALPASRGKLTLRLEKDLTPAFKRDAVFEAHFAEVETLILAVVTLHASP